MKRRAAIRQTPNRNLLSLLIGAMLILAGTIVQAQEDNGVSPVPELASALRSVQEADHALEKVKLQGDPQAVDGARQRYRSAQIEMEKKLAHLAGVQARDVSAMREVGMGWAQIAQELGMAPGLLGLQQEIDETPSRRRLTERYQLSHSSREGVEATTRDIRTKYSPKHGMAAIAGGSQGMGLGRAKATMSERSLGTAPGPARGVGPSGMGAGSSPGGPAGSGRGGSASSGPGAGSGGPGGGKGGSGGGGSSGSGGRR